MLGKQAKTLTKTDVRRLLREAGRGRYPARDRVIVLMSVKAGLRACEISQVTWPMLLNAQGRIGDTIALHRNATKRQSGRILPMNAELRQALIKLRRVDGADDGPVIRSERGGPMGAGSVVNWFAERYRRVGLSGCSSHSGRRTFITNAATLIHRAGGSLRDVQQLAGHRSIEMTQRYIEGNSRAKRKLIDLI